MFLQMVWFACFVAGGLLLVWTAWKNHHLPAVCSGRAGPAVAKAGTVAAATLGCELHSYLLAVVLILGGIAALLVTGYVATCLAVRYLGSGAIGILARWAPLRGPDGPRARPGHGRRLPGLDEVAPARLQVRPSPRAVGPAVAPVPGHPMTAPFVM